MNAEIQVRQGKERLALANISGAMMIQAAIPTAFSLFFTPWHLATPSILAAVVTALAIFVLQWIFRAPAGAEPASRLCRLRVRGVRRAAGQRPLNV